MAGEKRSPRAGAALTRRQFSRWLLATVGTVSSGMLLGGCARGAAAFESDAAAGAGAYGSGDAEAGASMAAPTEGAGSAAGGVQGSQPLTATEFLFDTVVSLTIYGSQEALDEAVERCRYFEGIFSRTVEGSDVWRINEAAGEPVTVAAETADIIERSRAYSELSGGLFDITIGAVTRLWDFKEGVKPDDDVLAEAVSHIDYRGVAVDGDTVQLADPAARIDLGGIAKGYIADDIASLLRECGVESACINLGGNVAVVGTKPDGAPWNVGVQDPNGAAQDVIASVPCADASVVTSGLYERQFTQDGVLYYHILDPRTGYPVATDLVSTSLKTDSSTDGDAYATMLFLMGHEAALSLVNGDARFEGLMVDSDGAVALTDNATFELLGATQ